MPTSSRAAGVVPIWAKSRPRNMAETTLRQSASAGRARASTRSKASGGLPSPLPGVLAAAATLREATITPAAAARSAECLTSASLAAMAGRKRGSTVSMAARADCRAPASGPNTSPIHVSSCFPSLPRGATDSELDADAAAGGSSARAGEAELCRRIPTKRQNSALGRETVNVALVGNAKIGVIACEATPADIHSIDARRARAAVRPTDELLNSLFVALSQKLDRAISPILNPPGETEAACLTLRRGSKVHAL